MVSRVEHEQKTYNPQGGGGGGYPDIFIHTSFFWVQNFFQYFVGFSEK